jgi:hypothetical protein
MAIEASGAYRDGAIHPDQPLPLPENTPVRVIVVPQANFFPPVPFPITREDVLATWPKSLRITPEEFDRIVDAYSISAPPLPDDFSRADIYSDHD